MKHLSLRGAEMLCKLNDNRLHQGRCRVWLGCPSNIYFFTTNLTVGIV
jgi:hypothetical protein